MTEKDSRPLLALLFAALTVIARLPFLVSGKIPFDSDEAVEGLMALHVLEGELPAFFWGQAFKGVPEVYAAAGAFALFGPSVVVLKSVTLLFFASYVALNFVLLDRIASRWLAAGASLLLVFSPPALVLWSLCASAEYVLIMLLGTLLLLLCVRPEEARRAESRAQRTQGSLLLVGLVIGVGLWVHQLFVIYLLPLLAIGLLRGKWWRAPVFSRPNAVAVVIGAVALVYVGLGLIAFFTSGLVLHIGPISLRATAPQKMLRIAVAIAGLAVLLQMASRTTREQAIGAATRYWPLAAGVALGYLPVLLYSALVEPARAPARAANLRQLLAAAPDIFGNIVPIVAGFKLATTERLALPSIAVAPGAAALAAYVWSNRTRVGKEFFPTFVVFVPVLFLGAGVYLDTLSYRYLIPWYAGLSVAWAGGSRALAGKTRWAILILGAIIGIHAWQQWAWYAKLEPDAQSLATIECLKRNGVRGGFAEYWTSYKLTFLAQEEIIFAPTDGVDRYPKYTEFVRSLPSHEQLANAGSAVCR